MTTAKEIRELVSELKRHFEKVKAESAFVALKQSELRPGDQMSFFGFLEAKESLAMNDAAHWNGATCAHLNGASG